MTKNSHIILIAVIILSLASISLSLFLLVTTPKPGYIEIGKLYAAFNYKKELEADYKNVESRRKTILDSLKLNYNVQIAQYHQNKVLSSEATRQIQLMQEQYKMKEEQFKQDNTALADKYTQQILSQLNQYVQEFGKINNYSYIFGANSSGTLMYARDADNITDKVLTFINKKYEGKGK